MILPYRQICIIYCVFRILCWVFWTYIVTVRNNYLIDGPIGRGADGSSRKAPGSIHSWCIFSAFSNFLWFLFTLEIWSVFFIILLGHWKLYISIFLKLNYLIVCKQGLVFDLSRILWLLFRYLKYIRYLPTIFYITVYITLLTLNVILKSLFSFLQTLHNKLQSEKSRLAMAVQACEAATASISRPSSPRDTLPPPVPIKELECRARLEDVIDQVRDTL